MYSMCANNVCMHFSSVQSKKVCVFIWVDVYYRLLRSTFEMKAWFLQGNLCVLYQCVMQYLNWPNLSMRHHVHLLTVVFNCTVSDCSYLTDLLIPTHTGYCLTDVMHHSLTFQTDFGMLIHLLAQNHVLGITDI